MDNVAFSKYLSQLLDKIYYLSEETQKKCHVLSAVEDSVRKCNRIRKLCNRIKKNCVFFENELVEEALKYNILLENEEANSTLSDSNTSHNAAAKSLDNGYVASMQKENLRHGLTISLRFGDTVKSKDIFEIGDINFDKFWLDLVNFSENILISYKNQGDNTSPSAQMECASSDVRGDDELLRQIREIFGSDSDTDNEETTTNPPNNIHLKNIEKVHHDNFVEGNSINNCKNVTALENTAIVESSSNQRGLHNQKEEQARIGVTDNDKTGQYKENDKDLLKEDIRDPTCRQIQVENERSIVEDVNSKSIKHTDTETDREVEEQNVAGHSKNSAHEQTKSYTDSNVLVENEGTTETEKDENKEKEVDEPLCASQITRSLEEAMVFMANEENFCEASDITPEKEIPRILPPLDEATLNADEGNNKSVDSTLIPDVVIAPENVEVNTENLLESTVQKNDSLLTSACSPQDMNLGAEQSPSATCRNIPKEAKEALDIEATKIVLSGNSNENNAASEDMEETQNSNKIVRDPDTDFRSTRTDFMLALGLTNSNVDVQLNGEDSMMDVLVEVSHRQENDEISPKAFATDKDLKSAEQREYEDQEVDDALGYIQQLDSFSESGSIKSDWSDSLLFSDIDDSIQSQTSDLSQNDSKSSQGSVSNCEQNTEETTSDNTTIKQVLSVDNLDINFVPKDCTVKIEKVDLINLQKYYSDAGKRREEHLKKQYSLKDCYVKLEYPRILRVSSDSDEEKSSSSNDDDEINRLCNLSILGRKRKKREDSDDSDKNKENKLRRVKRKRKVNLSGSDKCDNSGYSSVSDWELEQQKSGIFDEEIDVENKELRAMDPNELLTEIVCHTIHDSDSWSSEMESNEDVKRKKLKNKNSSPKKDLDNTPKRSSWRDDPLLKGSLDISSNKKTNCTKIRKRRRKSSKSSESDSGGIPKQTKKWRQLDPDWRSDNSSSANSSGDEFDPKPYIHFLKKTKVSSLSSDDSDVQVTNNGTTSKSSVISLDSDEEQDKKPGRRNILSVLMSAQLTRETQKAAKEEELRVLKLKMRDQMRTTQSQVSTEDSIILDTSDSYNLTVDPVLSKRLFPHQVEGVKFMWDACYLSLDSLESFEGTGCILAHNMGLGKTFQVFTLVHTLFSHSITNTKHVLIVCPLSTVSGWSREFKSGLKVAANKTHINVISIQSSDDSDAKFACINRWKQKGGVLIIGYEAFQKMSSSNNSNKVKAEFTRKALVDPGPDLVVCDEGHLLKNGKALRTRALMEIRTKRRIALTGTPLQNNLLEYYFMVQFVKPNLLGTYHEFRRQFVNPIMNGQYEDSDEADITLMKKRTHVLHRLLKNTVQRYEVMELQKYLGNMKDYALFIDLHPVQKKLYKEYMEMAKARRYTNSKQMKFFFKDYQLARHICSHPQLLYTMETQNAQVKKKVIKEQDIISEEPEVQEIEGIPDGWWKGLCSEEVKTNLEFGTKLQVMIGIIEEAEKIDEKVLIFSSSLVELSSIEYFLKLKGTSSCPSWRPRRDYFRMDGTVSPSVRTQMCDMFNNVKNKTLRVFLMSHKVGGLGLNLVAASRIILLGANFNPSHDAQSIFRAYRFGQEKCVYIYRLLSMGTMEEKIYQRCITKLAIASRVVDKHQIARHFKNLDLDDLYKVAVDFTAERTMPTKPDDDLLSKILLNFKCIYKYHKHQKLLENRPHEDLNEEDKMKAWEEFKQISEPNVNTTGNTSNPTSLLLPHQVTSDLYRNLSQHYPISSPNSDVALDPLACSPATLQMVQANNSVTEFHNKMSRTTDVGGKSINLLPNPAILRVNTETNSMNDALTLNEKSTNDDSNPVVWKSDSRNKKSMLALNPFVLGKANIRKENVVKTKEGITPFRKSSSDDFQKPSYSKHPRTNVTSRLTPGTWTSTVRASGNVNKAKTSTKNVKPPTTLNTVEDDDVIVVDFPQKQNLENSLQDKLDQLNNSGLSISVSSKKSQKKKPVDAESIIEIL